MDSDVVTVKVEPPDEFGTNQSDVYQNGLTEHAHDGAETSNSGVDTRNFTCLLCDLVYESRDDLRRHLKVGHASKNYFSMPSSSLHHGTISDSVLTGFSSYVNYRYTCTVCGAKFKAFRSYLTHSMSHRGTRSLRSHFDEVRMATILTSGKQYLQECMESEGGYPASFTCDECKTVFSQRDSYAMHMMMRAMNESCASALTESHNIESARDAEEPSDQLSEPPSVSPRTIAGQSETTNQPVSIKSLEDVTLKVDQDEYLKSVLDRVFVRDSVNYDRINNAAKCTGEFKVCTFCGNSFEDQDSLAMHVMSDHAEQIIPNKRKSGSHVQAPKPAELHWVQPVTVLNPNLTCKICAQSFVSRDSLAMHVLAHTQERSAVSITNTIRAMNQLKRAQQFEDYSQHNKSLKSDDPLDMSSKHVINSKTETDNMVDSLYCNKCNIGFYAESEFVWHNNHQHRDNGRTDTNPLCLSNLSTDLKENTDITKETKLTRTRRNSFSCEGNSRLRNPAPRRPLSTGNVAPCDLSRRDVTDEDNATDLSQKSTRTTAISPNVNALSSHEQKIIYSVFGKDLRMNLPTQPDKKADVKMEENPEMLVKPQKLDTKVRPNTSKSPLNLSLAQTRSTTSGVSGYSNGDKDYRSLPASVPKDAAMCKYCEILFLNKAIYYLHMGLHNVNNPWQCNVCGKVCVDAVDFAAHVIHM